MNYIVELFDHRDKTKVIEYAKGYDEVDAIYQVMNPDIERYPKMTVQDLREMFLEKDIQFVGIMVDTFVWVTQKINTEAKKEYSKGGRNEVSKSTERSNREKQGKRKSSRRGHHR